MVRSILSPLVTTGLLGGPASSQPLFDESKAYNPYSETAMAIAGPVPLSTQRMVFETGRFLDLELQDPETSGKWGLSGDVPATQVFRVSGDVGPLRQRNTLCGDQPIKYMAAWNEENSGFGYLGIAMFTGMAAPTSVADQAMCATYFYTMGVTD